MKGSVLFSALILFLGAYLEAHLLGLVGNLSFYLPVFLLSFFVFLKKKKLVIAILPAGLYLDLISPDHFGIFTLSLLLTAFALQNLIKIPLSTDHPFFGFILGLSAVLIFFTTYLLEAAILGFLMPDIDPANLFASSRLFIVFKTALAHSFLLFILLMTRELIFKPRTVVIIEH